MDYPWIYRQDAYSDQDGCDEDESNMSQVVDFAWCPKIPDEYRQCRSIIADSDAC